MVPIELIAPSLMRQLAQLRERQQILWRELYHFLLGKETGGELPLSSVSVVDC
ncbi:hypothetical protein [Erwinia sp. V71]|uniref:hypothetical protein n=1 Tax=Erwinia sp. V71 TaxID=3369424 RepID=UPI003F63C149